MAATSSLLKKLNDANTKTGLGAREEMLNLAHSLVASLETPSEVISRVGWTEPARFVCMRTAIDLGIFQKLNDSKTGMSAKQLADATGADEAFTARMLKHLVATNMLAEQGTDLFVNTPVSSQFTESKYADGIIYCYDVAGPAFHSMPTYFADTKYANPINPVACPFQHAHKTEAHFFPWLVQNPKYLAAFGSYMSGYRAGKPSWMDPGFYPIQDRLASGVGKEDVLIVDVGGGSGHDLLELKQKLPNLPGQMIVQDKPEVIEAIPSPLPTGITAQTHDFFTPQPVKGARAYFLHSVLHDWDDASSKKILLQLKDAMKPGHSKLLIHELVVPDRNASWAVTSMDWLMMALGAVRERTEADWRRLLDEAGFKVEGLWMVEQGTETVIEAVVKA